LRAGRANRYEEESPETQYHYKLSFVKSTMHQVLLGLKQMHDISIVHRDLKPDNLIWRKDDVLKYIDFGISKELLKE